LISSEEKKKSSVKKKKNYFARLSLFFSPVSFCTEELLKLIYLSLKTLLCFLLLLISSRRRFEYEHEREERVAFGPLCLPSEKRGGDLFNAEEEDLL